VSPPRLIVVEGIAGSGKSTMARHLGGLLASRGIPHRVVLEGDLDHPADFASVAWMSECGFAALCDRHPVDATRMAGASMPYEGGILIPYGKLHTAGSTGQAARRELAAYDIYEQPADDFRPLALRRWQEFGRMAAAEPDVWVFDCCLLQNPITTLVMKHNADDLVVREHLRAVIAAIEVLDPIVVHLHPGDIRATLDRVIPQRSAAWWDQFVRYHTEQAYGKAHGLHGIDGTVQALQVRQHLEEDLLACLPIRSVRIDTGEGWDAARSSLTHLIG
jgi:hypothetical protein